MSTESLQPLEGENTIPSVAPRRARKDPTRLLIGLGIAIALIAILGTSIAWMLQRSPPATPAASAASLANAPAQALPLKMPSLASSPAPWTASGPAVRPAPVAADPLAASTRVPALAELPGEAIPLRAAGAGAGGGAPRHVLAPEDAPIFAADAAPDLHGPRGAAYSGADGDRSPADASLPAPPSTANPVTDAKASLAAYRGQLQGYMDTLQRRMSAATRGAGETATPGGATFAGSGAGPSPGGVPPLSNAGLALSAGNAGASPALFGMLEKSATTRVQAQMMGYRHLTVPKGTLFLCSLKTRVISATSGFVGCQTERNVYSDSGKVLLIDRGSHLDGEYRIVQVKPGVTRIPVLWTRLRTPDGVSIDLDSPATGELGESGLGGVVDNRWGERLGAALMLSMIQDAIQYETARQSSQDGSTQVILPNTSTEGGKLAEQVLNTTINIPPLIYQNQGGVAGVYVARDIDFSSVYALRAQ